MLAITEMLIPVNVFSRPGIKLKARRGLVMHYTASNGAPAVNIAKYFAGLQFQNENDSKDDTYASAQYSVDRKSIYRVIPDYEMAYHCGSKTYTAEALAHLGSYPNNSTIGIEMCIEKDGSIHEETFQNAADLAAYLITTYAFPENEIWTHKGVVGWKDCPLPWIKNPSEYERFKKEVNARLHPVIKPSEYRIDVNYNGAALAEKGISRGADSYTPLRAIAERSRTSVNWDAKLNKAILNSRVMDSSFIINGVGFAKSTEVAAALGLNVAWGGKDSAVSFDEIVHECNVIIGGKTIKGFIRQANSNSYVAVRDAGDAAGAKVGWDQETLLASLNGTELQTNFVYKGISYAHTREVAAALGLNVKWDGVTNTVKLTKE